MNINLKKREWKVYVLLSVATLLSLSSLYGQHKLNISGTVKNQNGELPIAFATVALYNARDSALVIGTVSNLDGQFSISSVVIGNCYLSVSCIGYRTVIKSVEFTNEPNHNVGTILMHEEVVNIDEVVVIGERIKAKAGLDKTTFFMTKDMYEASNTGADILKHIPGIQVDFMQNISFEGSQNINILVDGKERDINFLRQLNAKQIDKVEVISIPNSKYDANVTGVLNIILKDKESGLNGHVYAEVPTSKSEIYLFPSYSLNYGYKKFNFYTSYNGEIINFFNITESSNRKILDISGTTEIISIQNVKQNNWSHRFNYGIDFFMNKKNQFNFYSFYNPYSREHDGSVDIQATIGEAGNEYWLARKEDTDINYKVFYSLYYKHIFNNPNQEITFDLTYYRLKAENTTAYVYDSTSGSYLNDRINTVKPEQNSASLRIDFTSQIIESLKLDAGVKCRLKSMEDKQSDIFEYNENNFAIYGTVTYTVSKINLSTGLRVENSTSGLFNSFNNHVFALLPHTTINYKFTPKQNIKLSYSRSIYRPYLYQLNPYVSVDDPYRESSGNPDLEFEIFHNLSIDYSVMLGNNYFSYRFFYNKTSNALNNLTFINDSKVFETRVHNLGTIHQYGIQFTGALKLNKAIALNPYFKLFKINTIGNYLAEQYNIENKCEGAFESGLSAIVTFKNNLAASLLFQYNSPKTDIQNITFSDALYFLSLEKSFKEKFKIGIMSGVPFTKSFTYQGMETKGEDFYIHSESIIKISVFPVWFKLRYQFNSGKKVTIIDRDKEKIDSTPKKGF